MRQALSRRTLGPVGTVMTGAIVLLFVIVSVGLIAGGSVGLGVFIAAMAAVMGVLFLYLLRDTAGNLGWCIAIGADALDLDLPRGRSLIHRLDPVHSHIRFDEIEAVEGRLEAYATLRMTNMQRAYALKLKTGSVIILGEDRALNSDLESSIVAKTVERIVRRGKLGTRDLGMVEGSGGILGVLFASAPPWDAPSLSAERQAALWADAGMTGSLAKAAMYVTLLGTPAFATMAKVVMGREAIEARKHLEVEDGPGHDARPFGKGIT